MYRSVFKRLIDLIVATVLLIALSPLFLLTALTVRLTLGSPVLFRQTRPGREGRPFMLLKFRTMTAESDKSGRPLADARRLTAVGRVLRATSIDELPQLLNVIRGEMSLVGPRPLLVEYLPRYSPEQARRHKVRPGITGWAQVKGRNRISWQQKFVFDVWYVDHLSAWLDARILALTMWKLLTRDGIQESVEVATPFAGGE